MAGVQLDLLAILRSIVPQFLIVAEYYALSDELDAQLARDRIWEETLTLDAFHLHVCCEFRALEQALRDTQARELRELQPKARNSVRRALPVLNSLTTGKQTTKVDGILKLHLTMQQGLRALRARFPNHNVAHIEDLLLDELKPEVLLNRIRLDYVVEDQRQQIREALTAVVRDLGNERHERRPPIVKEWDAARDFFESSHEIHNLLRDSWRCSCDVAHGTAKFAVSICTASTKVTPQQHVVHLERAGGKFGRPLHITSLARLDESGGEVIGVHSLCETLNSDGIVALVASDDRLLWQKSSRRDSNAVEMMNVSTTMSLDEWLKCSKRTRPIRERLVLALLLTYAYFHLSGSKWWPDKGTHPDVWLLISDHRQTVDMSCILLSASLETSQSLENNWPLSNYLNETKPSLPSFGRLLLQVYHGREIAFDKIADSDSSTNNEAMYFKDARQLCEQDALGMYYLAAADTCLRSNNDLCFAGLFRNNERARMIFMSKVVSQIQYVLEEGFRFDPSNYTFSGDPQRKIFDELSQRADQGPIRETSILAVGENINPRNVRARNRVRKREYADQYDGNTEDHGPSDIDASKQWMNRFESIVHPVFDQLPSTKVVDSVRIAVLDTGAEFDHFTRMRVYNNRLVECRTWYRFETDSNDKIPAKSGDEDGHGSHVTSLVLRVARNCHVYAAQVFRSKQEFQDKTTSEEADLRISQAIRYAVDVWKVDIITMSFGFQNKMTNIDKAIDYAGFSESRTRKRVLFFAAASNSGANKEITWPARRNDVLCIHAGTAYGKGCSNTPPPSSSSLYNFMTLGKSVEAAFRQKDTPSHRMIKHRSGSSVATPIAAGIAALVLELLRHTQLDYIRRSGKEGDQAVRAKKFQEGILALTKPHGMSKILGMMAQLSDGYDWLVPEKLFHIDFDQRVDQVVHIIECLKE